nr:hypothetical protein GCM10017745_48590 [Saccharothrix mutabilis subsp. capreolus]
MCRPGRSSVSRCARPSSASSGRTPPVGRPARLAAAARLISGPGCRLNSRNNRAAAGLSVRYDHENTARTSRSSPVSNASNRVEWSPSSSARTASGIPGWVATRAVTMPSANGNPAQCRNRPSAASGSAASRSAPRCPASRSRASSWLNISNDTGRAPCVVTRLVSLLRLVTSTVQVGLPGSSGVTWPASAALSSTTRTLLSATRVR